MIILPCKKSELYRYSKHQGRMLLLDQVDQYSFNEKSLTSSLSIHENSEFLYNGNIPIWVSFEYMAQSIALWSSLSHIEHGEKSQIGFIMNIREFYANESCLRIDDKVEIHIKQIFQEDYVGVFNGTCRVNGMIYSQCILNTIENNSDLIKKWKQDIS